MIGDRNRERERSSVLMEMEMEMGMEIIRELRVGGRGYVYTILHYIVC